MLLRLYKKKLSYQTNGKMSSSAEMVREAALYLEYFLKGLSECNVVGSYTVQFLELRSFNVRLEASLADHLKCLVINMKGLLMKLDSSFIPYCNTGVQTEDISLCSLCNSHSTIYLSPEKDSKKFFEEVERTCENPEIDPLLTSNPLIQLKQEIPCLNAATSRSVQFSRKENITNIIHIDSTGVKDPLALVEHDKSPGIKTEKCSVALSLTALDDNLNIGYTTAPQMEEGQGEILLDHQDGSDSTHSEGLMYSIYTMNSCGALQLVSRVLNKNNSSKDGLSEPVEKAMIEINNLKEELYSPNNLAALAIQENNNQDQGSSITEEGLAITDSSLGNPAKPYSKIISKIEKPARLKHIKKVEGMDTCIPKFSEIVKLGPEDLGNGTWCNVCEKEFPSVGSLKAHVSRTHSKVKWCNTCSKFITSADMNSHVQDYHSELPYVCNVCGQSLRTSGAFQRHMDIHKGLRGSACEVCGQTFSRTEYYRDHIRIHTGEKPFKCETCEKTFSRSSNLYAHMRIHNGEEQRHMCKLCLKSFARADKLKEHTIRHLQVKRFACRLCSKSYRERRDLIKHLGKIHASDRSSNTD